MVSGGRAAAGRRRPVRPELVIGLVATLVGLAARSWARAGAAPLFWNDSADYVTASHTSWWSLERLAGPRPVLMPSVLALAGHDLGRFTTFQTVAASVAWGLLAVAVAASVEGVGRKVLAGSVILLFSIGWHLVMWDQQVLTESTALTSLALVCTAGVWFAHRPEPLRAAALVAAIALWLSARDSHVVPVALVGLALMGAAVARRRSWPLHRVLLITGAYLLALSFVAAGSAQHGHRDRLPIEHVYMARILPYPERLQWFSDHGMPDGPALDSLPDLRDPPGSGALVTPVDQNPIWGRWRAWVRMDGRRTLLRYIASHPGYLWSEPTHAPERVFNNGDGVEGYRPLTLRDVAGPSLLYPGTLLAVVAGGLAVGILLIRRVRWTGLAWTGTALVVTSAPHALVVWHSDGMESARHLLVPGVQLRVGVLVLFVAAALGRDEDPVTVQAER